MDKAEEFHGFIVRLLTNIISWAKMFGSRRICGQRFDNIIFENIFITLVDMYE